MPCAESRNYISVQGWESGADRQSGQFRVVQAHALGQHDAEAFEQHALKKHRYRRQLRKLG